MDNHNVENNSNNISIGTICLFYCHMVALSHAFIIEYTNRIIEIHSTNVARTRSLVIVNHRVLLRHSNYNRADQT